MSPNKYRFQRNEVVGAGALAARAPVQLCGSRVQVHLVIHGEAELEGAARASVQGQVAAGGEGEVPSVRALTRAELEAGGLVARLRLRKRLVRQPGARSKKYKG